MLALGMQCPKIDLHSASKSAVPIPGELFYMGAAAP